VAGREDNHGPYKVGRFLHGLVEERLHSSGFHSGQGPSEVATTAGQLIGIASRVAFVT
jgi:hypothetical protein